VRPTPVSTEGVRSHMFAKTSRRLAHFVTVGVLAGATATILISATASAHTSSVVGVATCETTTHTWSIQWSGQTDSVPSHDIATVTTTAHTPSGSTVPVTVTTTLAPNASYSLTQTGIAGASTSASVTVHVAWTPDTSKSGNTAANSDTFAANASGSVQLTTGCVSSSATPTPTPTVTVTPTPTVTPVVVIPTTTVTPSPTVTPSVLGITIVKSPPTATPPAASLPFTGLPLVPMLGLAFGLVLVGGLLMGSVRRHRVSRS
jgi:hypothetical protein